MKAEAAAEMAHHQRRLKIEKTKALFLAYARKEVTQVAQEGFFRTHVEFNRKDGSYPSLDDEAVTEVRDYVAEELRGENHRVYTMDGAYYVDVHWGPLTEDEYTYRRRDWTCENIGPILVFLAVLAIIAVAVFVSCPSLFRIT